MQHAHARYALMACNKDAHTFSHFRWRDWLDPLRWKGQLAVSARHTITVEGDGAVFSRIMHIVTLAVRDFVDLESLRSYRYSVCQLRGLLWIPMQGGHPSEADVNTRFEFASSCLLQLCFAPAATR